MLCTLTTPEKRSSKGQVGAELIFALAKLIGISQTLFTDELPLQAHLFILSSIVSIESELDRGSLFVLAGLSVLVKASVELTARRQP